MNVCRLLLALALITLGTAAEAELVQYSKNAKGDRSFYDPATLRKNAMTRKVWVVQDLVERHKDGELSMRVQFEFDCQAETRRALFIATYAQPMAKGDAIANTNLANNAWEPIVPDSPGEALFKTVCR